jgi:xyloglucan-specific exo-beta-1,4-glucanase
MVHSNPNADSTSRKPDRLIRGLRRVIGGLAIALLLSLLLSRLFLAPQAAALSYQPHVVLGQKTVAIGGGGSVTGIYFHPRQPDLLYIRTDVGGFYRWQAATQTWLPLTDSVGRQQLNYYGGESLSLDPTDPQRVYIAVGKSHWFGPGTLLRSTDQGATWTKLKLDLPLREKYRRWTGERLAVNPWRPQELLFGSWKSGLWRSRDFGTSWTRVTTFVTPMPDPNIAAIAFDPGTSGLVYAYVDTVGLYRSQDGGTTWAAMTGSPQHVMRMAIASNGALYTVGYQKPQVSKYANGTWREISPPNSKPVFGAIAINPQNPQDIWVSRGEKVDPEMYRSLDGGTTWKPLARRTRSTVPWWTDWMKVIAWPSALAFDPHHRDRAWLVDWYGIWRTDDLSATRPTWTNYQAGHEEVAVFTLVAPPQGPLLLSGVGDVDGFVHDRGLDAFPSKSFGTTGPHFQDTYSIAYCETQPQRMVRVGGDRTNGVYTGATSQDSGFTWKPFPTFPKDKRPIRVTVSATNPDLFLVTTSKDQPLRTTDGGKTWSPIKGLPNGQKGPWTTAPRSLVADPVDGQTFYYYSDGKLYRSTNGGAEFTVRNDKLSWIDWHTLQALPGKSGDLWLGLEDEGLRHSGDGGATWERIPSVVEAYLFDFGKPAPGSTIPALYVYGKIVGKGEGTFRSLDLGKTWAAIGTPKRPMGNFPSVLAASRQKYGLVFVGTHGRGIYYGSQD